MAIQQYTHAERDLAEELLETQLKDALKQVGLANGKADQYRERITTYQTEASEINKELSDLRYKTEALEAKLIAFKKVLNNLDISSETWTTIIEEIIDRHVY